MRFLSKNIFTLYRCSIYIKNVYHLIDDFSFIFMEIFSRKMDTFIILVIFKDKFRRRTNAAETVRNFAFGAGTINERTVLYWFKRIRDGNFDWKNELRGKPTHMGE